MTGQLGGRATIVGIGATEFSKQSGRTPRRLALEAAKAVHQIDDVEHVRVTAGTGVPTSGLVLGGA